MKAAWFVRRRLVVLAVAAFTALATLACEALTPGGITPTFDPTSVVTVEANTPQPPPTGVTEEPPPTEAVPTETALATASETPAAGEAAYIAYVLDGQLLVTSIAGGVVAAPRSTPRPAWTTA